MARHHPAPRGSHDVALLNEVRLQDVLDGVALFADRCGEAVDTHRPTVELLDHGQQQPAILVVEAALVDVEHVQRQVGDGLGDVPLATHLGEVDVEKGHREATAQRGEGDAEAARLYAQAAQKDPGFYAFQRSLDAYRAAFKGGDAVIVLDRNDPFLQYLRSDR